MLIIMRLSTIKLLIFFSVISLLLLSCKSVPRNEETKRFLEDQYFEVPKEERLRILNGTNNNIFFIEYVGTPSIPLDVGREKWHIKAKKLCSEKSYKHVFTKNWMESVIPSDSGSSNNYFDPNVYCNKAGVMECIIGGALGLILADKLISSEKNKGNKFPIINGKVTCES